MHRRTDQIGSDSKLVRMGPIRSIGCAIRVSLASLWIRSIWFPCVHEVLVPNWKGYNLLLYLVGVNLNKNTAVWCLRPGSPLCGASPVSRGLLAVFRSSAVSCKYKCEYIYRTFLVVKFYKGALISSNLAILI